MGIYCRHILSLTVRVYGCAQAPAPKSRTRASPHKRAFTLVLLFAPTTHAYTHLASHGVARTHARTYARTHARTHAGRQVRGILACVFVRLRGVDRSLSSRPLVHRFSAAPALRSIRLRGHTRARIHVEYVCATVGMRIHT